MLISLWSRRQSFTFAAAILGTMLTALGFLFAQDVGVPVGIVLTNRLMSVFAIWATAILCLWQKRKTAEQARLLAQRELTVQENRDLQQALDLVESQRSENQRILGSIPSILVSFDDTGRITKWNRAAETIFGVAATDAVGRSIDGLTIAWNSEQLMVSVRACMSGKRSVGLEDFPYKRADGQSGFLTISITPVCGNDGKVQGILLLGTDITERRNLESQLSHTQKLESIGQLAAGIAHEINTPIQYVGDNVAFLRDSFSEVMAVMGKYEDLRDRARSGTRVDAAILAVEEAAARADIGYLGAEVPKAIEQTLEGVSRVAKIVRAMKEFSHPSTDGMVASDLNQFIENTIIVARNEWKYVAELVTDFAPGLPLVPSVAGEFNQVILNLIVNAAHAIGDRNKADPTQKGRITISTRAQEHHVEIRIKDTGTGIPEAVRSRVFDPFFTTKPVGKGTGQGLAIAHAVIVRKHSGSLTFETELGSGTTFIIRLPIAIAAGDGKGLDSSGRGHAGNGLAGNGLATELPCEVAP